MTITPELAPVPAAPSLALYLHIPFCRTRCTYCAFNTYTGLDRLIEPYTRALAHEIRVVGGTERRAAHTIYFGGGTPSLVPPDLLVEVLAACADAFTLAEPTEVTLETNPATVDLDALKALRQIGINRISIGMQSAHASELKLFARGHTADDVRDTVRLARRAGFDNLSLDLIYGNPGQTFAMWQTSLDAALSMQPEHLSMYSLGIEDGTPMQRWVARGQVEPPDADLAADMYEWAIERLARAGFEQYEISNWAKPGYECEHNLQYWRDLPYLGLGAGAHGYAGGLRYSTVLRPADYIARMMVQPPPLPFPRTAAWLDSEAIDAQDEMAEIMVTGLRLTRTGVEAETFQARTGQGLWAVYGEQIRQLIRDGLLEQSGSHVRLTPRGRLLGNLVFEAFV
ncbi:radical SAM family heme chaperone HemW [Aggregatilinea lenta]|uniref:radical SAM family heme chaperone HemW n=1 Tax=Aggregatilinea lenta TaxID=913108 RepID=UPI0013C34E0D|nr:radical SAM family heme chaperone HemW [Aggregatilinea lenta]